MMRLIFGVEKRFKTKGGELGQEGSGVLLCFAIDMCMCDTVHVHMRVLVRVCPCVNVCVRVSMVNPSLCLYVIRSMGC